MNRTSKMPFVVCGSLLLGSLVFAQTYGPTPILFPGATPGASPSVSPTPGNVTIQVKSVGQVQYLTDGQGRSVYLFEGDTPSQGQSNCTGQCTTVWNPVTIASGQMPTAGAGVDATGLGTITRPDGSTQVTYYGWPLYYYVPDQNPGATNGEGISSFGANWYLVKPDGTMLESLTPSASPTPTTSPSGAAGTAAGAGPESGTGGGYYY
jgi:predicted lipoprotein with Yx(FWY)xxD motif